MWYDNTSILLGMKFFIGLGFNFHETSNYLRGGQGYTAEGVNILIITKYLNHIFNSIINSKSLRKGSDIFPLRGTGTNKP